MRVTKPTKLPGGEVSKHKIPPFHQFAETMIIIPQKSQLKCVSLINSHPFEVDLGKAFIHIIAYLSDSSKIDL